MCTYIDLKKSICKCYKQVKYDINGCDPRCRMVIKKIYQSINIFLIFFYIYFLYIYAPEDNNKNKHSPKYHLLVYNYNSQSSNKNNNDLQTSPHPLVESAINYSPQPDWQFLADQGRHATGHRVFPQGPLPLLRSPRPPSQSGKGPLQSKVL